MAISYDNAASFYDRLSQLIFGRAIINAQIYLLQFVAPRSNILIVGGGTGWILNELTRLHAGGLKITYVEASAKMMAISAKRNTGNNIVTFVNAFVEDASLQRDFDVVITAFLFDNFSQPTAQKVFQHLNASLKAGGLWLYADFELNGKWWQPILLKAMQLFFKLLCRIEALRLPDLIPRFNAQKYTVIHSNALYGNFIRAKVYKRI